MKPVNRVAVIHDICGVGKAALTNIIPVLSVMGAEVCPIPTMILSTHTGGFGKPEVVKLTNYIDGCSSHYAEVKIDFQTLFIGYLGSKENIQSSINFIHNNKLENIVIDPIFGDNGSCYCNFDMDYVKEIRKLIKYGDLITPNYTEACLLAGEEYEEICSEEKLKRIFSSLKELGAVNTIITSLPSEDKKLIRIAIYENEKIHLMNKSKKEKSYPGTGDIFTAVLIGERLRGKTLIDSVQRAHNFVSQCIEESMKYDYPTKEGVLLERKLHLL